MDIEAQKLLARLQLAFSDTSFLLSISGENWLSFDGRRLLTALASDRSVIVSLARSGDVVFLGTMNQKPHYTLKKKPYACHPTHE